MFSGETSRRAVVYEIILDVVARNSTDFYKRKRTQVFLFTGIVVVGMTINIIKSILLTPAPDGANPAPCRIGEQPSHSGFVLTYLAKP